MMSLHRSDYVMPLGVLEQSPRLRTIYTQLCFCYLTQGPIDSASVTEKLNKGLEKLTVKFPWIAGQVVDTQTDAGRSATLEIVPFRKLPTLIMKDMSLEMSTASLQTLKAAKFPFHLLDEQDICPRTTLSEGPNETSSDPFPVLLLQANFFSDGLLLTVQACHSAMDIVGQVQIIQLLSRACKDEDFAAHEVEQGNLDRRNLIQLLEQEAENEEVEPRLKSSSQKTSSQPESEMDADRTTYQWAYFAFDSVSLSRLKVTTEADMPPECSFVSTDDALCALLWQSIGRARLARLPPITHTTFVRQVDMRNHMGLSSAFIGNMVISTTKNTTLNDLAHTSLGPLAAQLRSKLHGPDLKQTLQSNATSAAKSNKRSSRDSKDRSQLVVMSSWTKANCYNVDFGLGLGKPDCVRRPRFSPIEGVIYLLPKSLDGEIVAGLCLRADDMRMMASDRQLLQYARYLG